jgi:hypothetical protein
LQRRKIDRLGDHGVHPVAQALLLVSLGSVGGKRHDGYVNSAAVFVAPDHAGSLESIDLRHLDGHKDEVVLVLLVEFVGLLAIHRQSDGPTPSAEGGANHFLVDGVVFGNQDAQVRDFRHGRGSRRFRRRRQKVIQDESLSGIVYRPDPAGT